ncbi:hypothetical protein F2Q69_00042104 [Brassica cretica]|uniref:Uncharacterized protein n=1 Tax=Brassica cretica TaxID=69181 RepID=A0A8S9NF49_BRACR|nr:hypothetical protein F2Q69_00042104 [Brassica cretica]
MDESVTGFEHAGRCEVLVTSGCAMDGSVAGFNQMILIFHLDISGSDFGRPMRSLLRSLLKYNALEDFLEVFQTTSKKSSDGFFQIWKTSGLEDFQMTSRRLPGSLPDEAKAKIQSAAVSRTSAPPELKMHIRGEGPHTFENIEYHMVIDEAKTDTQGHHLWTWQCATVKRSLDMEMQPQASNSSASTAQPTQAQRQSQSYSQAQPQGQGQAPFSGSVSSSR